MMYDRSTSKDTFIRLTHLPNASATGESHSLECSWDPLLISPGRRSCLMGVGGDRGSISVWFFGTDGVTRDQLEQKSDWQVKVGVYLLDLKEPRDPKDHSECLN